MRHILTLEKFSKQYQQKIDVKDFKKIKKGSKILYMGGQVEVLKNDGYVLTLKGEDGKKFTVNKSMFDHGGMIKEGVLDNITLMADASKDYEDFKKKFKKGFPKIFKPTPDFMDWLYGMYKDMAPDKVEEVYDGKKKKKKKPFHPDMMYEAKGKKVVSDLYKMDGQVDYLSDADDATKKIWKKAGVNPEDDDMIILYSYVNNWIPTKKLLDKSRIKYKELEDPNSAGESFIVFNVNESSRDRMIKQIKSYKKRGAAMVTLPSKVRDFYFKNKEEIDQLDEARAKKVTKQMWKRMNDDKRFDALLSVVKDPDDAEEYVEYKWEELPSGFEYQMVLFELSSAQDGTKDSDGKHKHEDHLEEDIETMWKKTYGEDFIKHYPAIAKIIRQRKIKDKREIARIWQDTYGEDFEKEYPALYNKL
jgi:hypothetical protein